MLKEEKKTACSVGVVKYDFHMSVRKLPDNTRKRFDKLVTTGKASGALEAYVRLAIANQLKRDEEREG
ncbi:hypothetical protein [Psychromonas aquimarina]|uniref:hypothetical protein n=1 Tax=Psychromonas aquimarina TaxID=444919 RepID=UPI00042382C4|nr:hypothetical protein [Psychromonas aquimarina]